MNVDDEVLDRVAALAKLSLTTQERAQFKQDFAEVLDAFSVLDEIDIPDDAPKTVQPTSDSQATLRADEPGQTLGQERALAYTDDSEEGYFIGPKVTKK